MLSLESKLNHLLEKVNLVWYTHIFISTKSYKLVDYTRGAHHSVDHVVQLVRLIIYGLHSDLNVIDDLDITKIQDVFSIFEESDPTSYTYLGHASYLHYFVLLATLLKTCR